MKDCSDLEEQYDAVKAEVRESMDIWENMPSASSQKALLGKSLSDLLWKGVKIENNYNECLNSIEDINELIGTYFDLWNDYFRRSKWDTAIEQYKKIVDLDAESYQAYYNIGAAFLNKNDLENAFEYYQHARYYAHGKSQIQESKKSLDNVEKELKKQKETQSAPSDDTFSHLQHYLHDLSVPEAWKKVNKSKEVIVAVIDDGININHPDLTDHIWVSSDATYGSSKIKNFVGDDVPDNFPTGEHGTMISGIIAATINNQKWIAGIAKNVKIMPLRVFDFRWNAREDTIIKAINYAIDNHANIINLSLGQSQFAYSQKYDEVMKKAYEHGVIVVVAAGNGDVLSFKNSGVNTTINPLSPVCNNWGNRHYSVGVESLDQKWVRARWSNYGSCVSFSAPGENIFSTSISVFNKEYGVDYDTESGTSFSAPMIAGVIALGYNQYGYVSPDTVYASLNESLQINNAGNYVVNAAKYIDILGTKQAIIKQEQDHFATGKNVWKKDSLTNLSQSQFSKLSDADYLATLGYIEKKSSATAYKLTENILRQEVTALAIKVMNIHIPENYTCRGIFADVSANRPNSWACRIIENALDKGIITTQGIYFKPEEPVSLVEAAGILLRAWDIKIQQYSGGELEPWQANIIGTVFGLHLVDSQFDFSVSRKATKGTIFSITRKILEIAQ